MLQGSLRLFQLFGITVYLHWSWLLVAAYMIQTRQHAYASSPLLWNTAEYLAIFAIVLMHEFGHALACRSVGGQADRIVLWPLGGVAFVSPPMRPGAWLWSLFAGPLVNIILLPITFALAWYAQRVLPGSNIANFANYLAWVNRVLLIFNLIPVYPLDGGQILQSLLWFFIGFIRSLRVAATIGMAGAAGFVALCVYSNEGVYSYVLAIFLGSQAYQGYQMAQALWRNREATITPTSDDHGFAAILNCEVNPAQSASAKPPYVYIQTPQPEQYRPPQS